MQTSEFTDGFNLDGCNCDPFQSWQNLIYIPSQKPTLLPATADRPRNIDNGGVKEPPHFFDTVKEMRARLMATTDSDHVGDNYTIADKAILRKWKAQNKLIYGNKVVSYSAPYKL